MLLKIERKVLSIISKQPDEATIEIDKFGKYSGSDIHAALLSLKQKGYLESTDCSIDYSTFTYELTLQGRFYKEYLVREFLSNIVIPILVSVITTLITLYLTA